MSVELLDTTRFHGFRVRRQIAGKTYQEYFSLKKDGKRMRGAARAAVKQQAEDRDAVLQKLQTKAKAEAAKNALFDKDGKVRGILFRMKTEKSGTRTPFFRSVLCLLRSAKSSTRRYLLIYTGWKRRGRKPWIFISTIRRFRSGRRSTRSYLAHSRLKRNWMR